jgi:MFS superfamily sulfate permease-like transporter
VARLLEDIEVPKMNLITAVRRDWLANPRADLLAGTVVALALIPEAIAFSIIAGVNPGSRALRVICDRGAIVSFPAA